MEQAEFTGRRLVGHAGQRGQPVRLSLMTSLGRTGCRHLPADDYRFAVLLTNRIALTISVHKPSLAASQMGASDASPDAGQPVHGGCSRVAPARCRAGATRLRAAARPAAQLSCART